MRLVFLGRPRVRLFSGGSGRTPAFVSVIPGSSGEDCLYRTYINSTKIATKPNKFEKFPHASEHYGNTVECTVCHSEHKASWALCNECHVVEFPNPK